MKNKPFTFSKQVCPRVTKKMEAGIAIIILQGEFTSFSGFLPLQNQSGLRRNPKFKQMAIGPAISVSRVVVFYDLAVAIA